MKVLVKTKLLGGTHIELRDYELSDKKKIKVAHCKSRDYRNCDHKGEGYMILTPSQQRKGKIVNTQQSKFYPYNYYKILKYLWKPVYDIDNEDIEINMDIRTRLAKEFRKKYL